jgi:hypothetical protein
MRALVEQPGLLIGFSGIILIILAFALHRDELDQRADQWVSGGTDTPNGGAGNSKSGNTS